MVEQRVRVLTPEAAEAKYVRVVDGDLIGPNGEIIPGTGEVPSTLPPSGPAGGVLAASYPNPALNAVAVDNFVAGRVNDDDSATSLAVVDLILTALSDPNSILSAAVLALTGAAPPLPGVVVTDRLDGSFAAAGSGVVDYGDGTFALSGSSVVDNGDGTYSIAA